MSPILPRGRAAQSAPDHGPWRWARWAWEPSLDVALVVVRAQGLMQVGMRAPLPDDAKSLFPEGETCSLTATPLGSEFHECCTSRCWSSAKCLAFSLVVAHGR